jgi:hypothetical protein
MERFRRFKRVCVSDFLFHAAPPTILAISLLHRATMRLASSIVIFPDWLL